MSRALETLDLPFHELRNLVSERRVFMLLDACDAPKIWSKLEELGSSKAFCLYRGDVSPELRSVAPYLVEADDDLLTWAHANVWNDPWGILIVAKSPLTSIYKHLRRYLVIQGPQGETMYFRFYDPRVLPNFLRTCNPRELEDFFGPCLAMGITLDDQRILMLHAS